MSSSSSARRSTPRPRSSSAEPLTGPAIRPNCCRAQAADSSAHAERRGGRIRVRGRVLAVVSVGLHPRLGGPGAPHARQGLRRPGRGHLRPHPTAGGAPTPTSSPARSTSTVRSSRPSARASRRSGCSAWRWCWVPTRGSPASFLSWLEQQRGALPSSRASLVLLLTAGGGMSYLWGTADPRLLRPHRRASLALVALMLMSLRAPRRVVARRRGGRAGRRAGRHEVARRPGGRADRRRRLLVAGQGEQGRRAPVRRAGGGRRGRRPASCASSFVVPVGRFVSVMRTVSSLTATASHGFGFLARAYASTRRASPWGRRSSRYRCSGRTCSPLRSSARGDESRRSLVALGAALLTAGVLPFVVGWHGGSDRGRAVVGDRAGGSARRAGHRPRCRRPSDRSRRARAAAAVGGRAPARAARPGGRTNVPLDRTSTVECVAMWMAR